jgi:putative transposase
MAHTFTNLLFHVIFGTKGHDPSIDADLRGALHAYVGGIVGEFKGIALSVNGTADHLHALIKIPPTMAIAEAMRLIKTNSSKWAHEKGAQEEHHRVKTFREEYLEFLHKHQIPYDPRYVFE